MTIWAVNLTLETEIYRADGTSGVVESLKVVLSPRIMDDFTIDEAHTYTIGEEKWGVHNCDFDPTKLNHIMVRGSMVDGVALVGTAFAP